MSSDILQWKEFARAVILMLLPPLAVALLHHSSQLPNDYASELVGKLDPELASKSPNFVATMLLSDERNSSADNSSVMKEDDTRR